MAAAAIASNSVSHQYAVSTTHNISCAESYIDNLDTFFATVEKAIKGAFPKAGGASRYSAVQVLLLSWEEDDLKVIDEVTTLDIVFTDLYGFGVEQWLIPSSDSHDELGDRLRAFKKQYSKEDTLLIVYYGGHGYLNDSRQPVWVCNQTPKASTVKWYAHQVSLEEAASDVLILLDCCHAGACSGEANTGVKEVIAACGFDTWAPGVGDHSFTKSLIEELKSHSAGLAFSAAYLHSKILDRLKHWSPRYNAERLTVQDREGRWKDMERRKTPVYISLNKFNIQKSIEIRSRLETRESHSDAGSVDSRENDYHTTVNIAIHVKGDATRNRDKFEAWLKETPLPAVYVKLQAVMESYSTLVVLSLPVAVENLLPDDPACSFIGFSTSSNLLLSTQTKDVDTTKCEKEISPLTDSKNHPWMQRYSLGQQPILVEQVNTQQPTPSISSLDPAESTAYSTRSLIPIASAQSPFLMSKSPKRGPEDASTEGSAKGPKGVLAQNPSSELNEEEQLLLQLKDEDNLLWKDIAQKFQLKFGRPFNVPALQMRFKRLRDKIRVWTEVDISALEEAYSYWESHKWDIITSKMLDFGCRERWPTKACQNKWEEVHPEIDYLKGPASSLMTFDNFDRDSLTFDDADRGSPRIAILNSEQEEMLEQSHKELLGEQEKMLEQLHKEGLSDEELARAFYSWMNNLVG